jgi:hypothetical protein
MYVRWAHTRRLEWDDTVHVFVWIISFPFKLRLLDTDQIACVYIVYGLRLYGFNQALMDE